MKRKNIARIIVFMTLFVAVVAYYVYAAGTLSKGDPTERCTRVSIDVRQVPHATFVDSATVARTLLRAAIWPVGHRLADIDTRKIEQALLANDLIESAQCYKSTTGMELGTGRVCIHVTQRVPVIHIMPDGAPSYYLDTRGRVISATAYVGNVVTATGNIDRQYAEGPLTQFGRFLSADKFWDAQIEQIDVARAPGGQHRVTLVPRAGDHIVRLGTLDNYKDKLHRLRVFYTRGLPQTGWNKYKAISLEYDGQVVATRR